MIRLIKGVGGLFLFLLLTQKSLGCTLINTKSATQFDPSEYIFSGEVVGYVGPVRPRYVAGEAWGLLIKAGGSVHLPKTPVGHFEVFRYFRQDDCSLSGASKEQLMQLYPAGSKLLVIARESKVEAATSETNLRLVIDSATGELLWKMPNHESDISPASEYDYRTSQEKESGRPVFELRKDLLRLNEARSESEKLAILERLVYYPPWLLIDYRTIAELHVKDRRSIGHLIKERERWTRR